MKEHKIIWSDTDLYYDSWKDYLKAEYPDMNDSELNELMYEINQNNLSDQRINLDILLNRPIIVIADLGFWNGRKSGYKVIESGNISDCLYSDCDYNKWYVDKYGDLRCTAVHHDGTNYYLYRSFKDSASERQINRLKDLIYEGKVCRKDILRVTDRLGDRIGRVYGWSFPGRKKREHIR